MTPKSVNQVVNNRRFAPTAAAATSRPAQCPTSQPQLLHADGSVTEDTRTSLAEASSYSSGVKRSILWQRPILWSRHRPSLHPRVVGGAWVYHLPGACASSPCLLVGWLKGGVTGTGPRPEKHPSFPHTSLLPPPPPSTRTFTRQTTARGYVCHAHRTR